MRKPTIKEEAYFNWRGKEVSRTENLSDIVFALALTLVVASSVPASFTEIASLWRDCIAIFVCFTMLLLLWYSHYLFFRRYDLEDKKTMLLNAILMFMVMVFAYPLKFLATFLVNLLTGGFENDLAIASVLSMEQAPWLTVIYSLGYGTVFFVFALLYHHAYKSADDLGLSDAERIMTRATVFEYFTHVLFAIAVAVLALMLPKGPNLLAGSLFILLGMPIKWINKRAEQKVANITGSDTVLGTP